MRFYHQQDREIFICLHSWKEKFEPSEAAPAGKSLVEKIADERERAPLVEELKPAYSAVLTASDADLASHGDTFTSTIKQAIGNLSDLVSRQGYVLGEHTVRLEKDQSVAAKQAISALYPIQ